MKNTIATFAQLVRFYRQERGLTQKQLANKARLSTSYITLLETGRRKTPGYQTVTMLAKAFELTGKELRALMLSAGYSEDVARKTSVDLSPPLMKKLSHFVNLAPGSPDGPESLRESLDLLQTLAAEKGLSRDHQKAIKATRLLTGAFFSTARDHDLQPEGQQASSKESPEIVLADRLREFLIVFVDGSIPIERRISIANELLSFVRWKIHGKKD